MKLLSILIISMISLFATPVEVTEINEITETETTQTILYSNEAEATAPSLIIAEELALNPGVCDIMPGSCACEAYGEGGHGDWDRFVECVDDQVEESP
jgi:hypothetical protein